MKLPKSLHQFFWDVDVKKIDARNKPYFIINRLLDKGNVEAVKWVRKNYSEKEIRETFAHIRDFNPKVGRFWSLFLQIPTEEVACLQPSYLKMRRTHWPY
ncbi:MAG: hypothetical protein AAB441_01495 [Patescibacteria group bacterium]